MSDSIGVPQWDDVPEEDVEEPIEVEVGFDPEDEENE